MPGHRQSRSRKFAARAQSLKYLESIAVREREIEQHYVDRSSLTTLDGLGHRRRRIDVVPSFGEENAKRVCDEEAVLDDENAIRHLVVRRVQRQREEEPASFAELAFDPDLTRVQLDEVARNCEPETGAVVRTRG
jgi:hypothetical protein